MPVKENGRDKLVEMHPRDVFGNVDVERFMEGAAYQGWACMISRHHPLGGSSVRRIFVIDKPDDMHPIGVARPVTGTWTRRVDLW